MIVEPEAVDGAIRVLVVEDDDGDFLLTRELLEEVEETTFQVLRAATCEQGLALLRSEPLDVVLLDYQLGAETALDFLGRVPLELRVPPVILLTGVADRQADMAAMMLGAVDFLQKPDITGRGLERAIRYAIQEQRAREELRREALLFDELLDAVIVAEIDGSIADWNPAAERTFGYRREEVLGRPLWFLHLASGGEERVSEAERTLRQEGRWSGELRVTREDGAERVVDAVIVTHRDDAGRPTCLIAVHRDVTDRRRSDDALRRRDAILESVSFAAREFLRHEEWDGTLQRVFERLGRATDVSRVYLFGSTVAPNGRILFDQIHEWVDEGIEPQIDNPAMQGMDMDALGFGHLRAELVAGRTCALRPDELPAEQREVLEAQQIRSMVVVPVQANGRLWGALGFDDCRRAREWPEVERDALASAGSILGAALEQQATSRALRESMRFLQGTVDALSAHIAILDEEGTILAVNERWRRFAADNGSRHRGTGVGANYLAVAEGAQGPDAEEAEATADGIRRLIAGELERFELEYACPTPSEQLWFLLRATRFEVDGGVRVVVAHENITSRKRAEEAQRRAAEQAQRTAERMRAVAVAAASVAGARSTMELAEAVHDACREVIDFDAFTCAQYLPASEELDFIGIYDGAEAEPAERLDVAGTPSEQVIREQRSVLIRSAADPAGHGCRPGGRELRSESVIRCPMASGERVMGVISVQSYRPDHFTADDVQVLETIASVAAAALLNLELTAQREAATAALAESEERFRLVVEHLGEGLLITDLDDRIIYANPRFCEIAGYGAEELTGRVASELLVPAGERDRVRSETRSRADGVASRYEVEIVRADGSTVWLEVHGVPFLDAEGRVIGAIGLNQDITERREAESERQRSAARIAAAEQHYRRLVENSPDGIFVVDNQGTLIEANRAMGQIFGRDPQELIGRSGVELLFAGDRERAYEALGKARIDTLTRANVAYRIERADRTPRIVQVHAVGVYEDGRRVGSHGVVRDITEERARDEMTRLRGEALDGLVHGVAMLDDGRGIVYANRAFSDLLRLPRDLQRLPRPGDLFADAGDAAQFERIAQTLRTAGRWSGRVQWRLRGVAEPVMLELVVGAVPSPTGEPLFLAIVSDATEAVRRDHQMRRVERLASVGTLLSGVAHELNNPLNSIANFAHLMLLDEREGEDQEALEIIHREAERAARIVSDLRFIARQTQEVDSDKDVVDLNDVVRHVLKLRRYALETNNIELVERLAGNLPPLWANRAQLEQVVLNLVINAEQAMLAMPADRRLQIRTAVGPSGVTLQVADSGPGIPPDHLARIFDPFFTTKSPGEGTGLGLSLVHSIVTEHQGEIQVHNGRDGGAAFTVVLPRALDESTPQSSEPLEAPGSPLRILVVDDEAALRRSIAHFLRSRSHEVVEATDGMDALRQLAGMGESFDVILSDLRMPGLGGDRLMEELREMGGDLHRRVVFMTGDAASADAGRILEATGSPALIKPVRLDEVARVIERVASSIQSGAERRG